MSEQKNAHHGTEKDSKHRLKCVWCGSKSLGPREILQNHLTDPICVRKKWRFLRLDLQPILDPCPKSLRTPTGNCKAARKSPSKTATNLLWGNPRLSWNEVKIPEQFEKPLGTY
jgi:hypothetical protein